MAECEDCGPVALETEVRVMCSHAHVIKLTFHSIVHRDIQEVCGSSRKITRGILEGLSSVTAKHACNHHHQVARLGQGIQ